ncbi:MAG: N-acetyl-gamma-glutamyl-phosphate reductase [Phototrophicales bacterium]|nr:MAG: N-acetyl-gamma-glutamyl-phosphate reductase [Phototrophicales bacterium]
MTLRVSIVGASGYTGGELLRLLLQHPHVEVGQVTSQSNVGKFVYTVHPHLRGQTTLQFSALENLEPCDVLFLALPHGESQQRITYFAEIASYIVDLSADFRLKDPELYKKWYEHEHQAPEWLEHFAYGLPEINRQAIRSAKYVSGVGCNATAIILALWPLVRAGLIDNQKPLFADVKVGSSEGGNTPTISSHHPHRVSNVRPFQLTGHRHSAEVQQAFADCGGITLNMSVSSVEMVRGVAVAVHLQMPTQLSDRDFWKIYRTAWANEPFIRIVHAHDGLYRHPEPRLVNGTNYADVGWAYDPASGQTVLLSAIDNLGKGAAGSAVQAMNLMCGFDETTALTFGGFYP